MPTALTTKILNALGVGFLDRAGPVLPDLVDGLTGPLAETDDLLTPTDRGWVKAFDLDQTPEPKWIGAATGTKVPGGLSLTGQRDYVRSRSSWRRGSPESIRGAVRAVLTGATRRVDLLERNGSPWGLKVRVWASELPGLDEAPVVAAATTQKPVGIIIDPDVEVVPYNATYAHFAAVHGTYAELLAEFPTPAAMAAHVPEEGTIF